MKSHFPQIASVIVAFSALSAVSVFSQDETDSPATNESQYIAVEKNGDLSIIGAALLAQAPMINLVNPLVEQMPINLGSIPYVGQYIRMAQEIGNGRFGSIPVAGPYIDSGINIAQTSQSPLEAAARFAALGGAPSPVVGGLNAAADFREVLVQNRQAYQEQLLQEALLQLPKLVDQSKALDTVQSLLGDALNGYETEAFRLALAENLPSISKRFETLFQNVEAGQMDENNPEFQALLQIQRLIEWKIDKDQRFGVNRTVGEVLATKDLSTDELRSWGEYFLEQIRNGSYLSADYSKRTNVDRQQIRNERIERRRARWRGYAVPIDEYVDAYSQPGQRQVSFVGQSQDYLQTGVYRAFFLVQFGVACLSRNLDCGMDLCAEGVKIADRILVLRQDCSIADYYVYVGLAKLRFGNYDEAIKDLRTAIALQNEFNDSVVNEKKRSGYEMLLRVYLYLCRFDEAETLLGEMTVNHVGETPESMFVRGLVDFFAGRYSEAAKTIRVASLAFNTASHEKQYEQEYKAATHYRLAQILIQQRKYDEANVEIDQTRKERLALTSRSNAGEDREKLAKVDLIPVLNLEFAAAMKRNRLDEAKKAVDGIFSALESNQHAGDMLYSAACRTKAALEKSLFQLDKDVSHLSDAIQFLQNALDRLNDEQNADFERGLVYAQLGDVQYLGKEKGFGAKSLANAERLLGENASPEVLIELWYRRALVERAAKRKGNAGKYLDKAIDKLKLVRRNLNVDSDDESKIFASYFYLFESMAQWAYEDDDLERIFKAMEGARYQSIVDLLKNNRVDPLTNAGVLDKINAMTADVSLDKAIRYFANNNILACEYLIGNDACYLLVYGAYYNNPKLFRLELDKKEFSELTATRIGEFKSLGVESGALTAKTLSAFLSNEKEFGILDYLRDNKDTEQEILHEFSNFLWKTLFPDDKLRETITSSDVTLLIVSDGVLTQLPFEALATEYDFDRDRIERYLLDEACCVLQAPSAGSYISVASVVQTLSGRKIDKALTAGAPNYRILHKRPGYAPLNGAKAEILSVKRACGNNSVKTTSLIGDDATEKNVVQALNVKDGLPIKLIHLACHGDVSVESGDFFCALALTVGDVDQKDDDGYLELKEILGLNLTDCQLTVLSCCDTGVGDQLQGEGTWSLARGFMTAGSKRVVSSLWKVYDDDANTLISDFINETLNANVAISDDGAIDYAKLLKQAKIKLKEKLPDPHFWSPFVISGIK